MFKLLKQSNKSQARSGIITTPRGKIATPFFMPDATRGYVRAVNNNDLRQAGVGPLVVNTYHLFLQPGLAIIKKSQGVHQWMNWSKPLLSDSGGFQVFSLVHQNPKMGKITDKGVEFKSPIDGQKHLLTPEKSMQIQFTLGTDIMVCFDDCPPNNSTKAQLKKSVERTIVWAKKCRQEYDKQIKKRKLLAKQRPLLFGVIQGGLDKSLRKHCAEELLKLDFAGFGFGGWPTDQQGRFLTEIIKYTAELIPQDKLRFALGVGKPEDIVQAVKFGWDMFDCVIPTREARHGKLYYWSAQSSSFRGNFYKTINITNQKFKNDLSPINPDIPELAGYTKAYLSYLFKTGDSLGQRLATINNLWFYASLLKKVRENIQHGLI